MLIIRGMERDRRMDLVHCAALLHLSIRLLFLLNAVYHRGNCHLDMSMCGRWEVKMCYSWREAEIVGLPPPNQDQNNRMSMFNNCPQWTEYFCCSATFSSACVQIIQPRGSDEGSKWGFFLHPRNDLQIAVGLQVWWLVFKAMLSVIKHGDMKQRGKEEGNEEGVCVCVCLEVGINVCQVECVMSAPQK